MIRKLSIVLISAFCFALPAASAQEREGDYLYQVTTVRAAPGNLEELLDWVAQMKASGFFEDAGEHPPFVMRHSQGDQWDLLKITPMESWTKYHSKSATKKRGAAAQKYAAQLASGSAMLAFAEDHFAYGPPLSEMESEFAQNGLFHIEMFEAAPGKASELIKQRQMENDYLARTGQTTNMIFHRAAGSDVDLFTIGFHESLEAFAAPSGATALEAEAAAKAAGFKDRADLSFYLRSLISGHHDTLATKVE